MVVELNITNDTIGFVFENAMLQDDINEVKSRIAAKLKNLKKINLYIEEDEVDDIKMGAFMSKVFYDIKHEEHIKKIAVVSNRKWIRGVAKIKDILIKTDVQAFELTERVDALCWVMSCK